MFPTVVKMFYYNLNYKDGITTYEVRKHQASLTLEEFVDICDLPCTCSLYKPDDIKASGDFNFDATSLSILSNKKWGIHSPFIMGYVCQDIQLIHYDETYILILRKFNLGKVSKNNVVLTWLLADKVEINWASVI